jgi:hypothetical protein
MEDIRLIYRCERNQFSIKGGVAETIKLVKLKSLSTDCEVSNNTHNCILENAAEGFLSLAELVDGFAYQAKLYGYDEDYDIVFEPYPDKQHASLYAEGIKRYLLKQESAHKRKED